MDKNRITIPHDDSEISDGTTPAQPGEIITFGAYPQTAEGTDNTPIQWPALENSGGELFVLSKYILDCKRQSDR